jgi:hypothetical protein
MMRVLVSSVHQFELKSQSFTSGACVGRQASGTGKAKSLSKMQTGTVQLSWSEDSQPHSRMRTGRTTSRSAHVALFSPALSCHGRDLPLNYSITAHGIQDENTSPSALLTLDTQHYHLQDSLFSFRSFLEIPVENCRSSSLLSTAQQLCGTSPTFTFLGSASPPSCRPQMQTPPSLGGQTNR